MGSYESLAALTVGLPDTLEGTCRRHVVVLLFLVVFT